MKSKLNLILLLVTLSLSATSLTAQRKNKKKEVIDTTENKFELSDKMLNNFSFRSIGPAAYSGRISDLAVNPENTSEYYVGVASGGLWKTINHGTTFKPIFDDQPVYSIGCLAMDPNNSNILWVGTGENNSQRNLAYGDGVYKTTDGGKTFTKHGIEKRVPRLGKL